MIDSMCPCGYALRSPCACLTTKLANVLEEFRCIGNDRDLHGLSVSVCASVRQFASHGNLPDAIRQHVSFQKHSPKADLASRFRKSQCTCPGQLWNGNGVCWAWALWRVRLWPSLWSVGFLQGGLLPESGVLSTIFSANPVFSAYG